ncbi:carbon-nitrogen hydrolase family protein [Mesorhizobium sp. CAU 1741]|uniref:carbon-nitrogen hydrolase family protein n=1 Tax=Mesorhizobium sp. CAU 1741 TaxID=3140366 RepID=UPI00325B7AD9
MKIAALQMQATPGNVAANLERIEKAAREAARDGADLLVAPELATTGYGIGEAIRDLTEPANGPTIGRLGAIAADAGVAIVAGFAEADGGSVWNSAAFVTPQGQTTVYRKSHLYGDYERNLFQPGSPRAVTFDHGGRKLGMLICYDVEFPENVRKLAQAGCSLVLVPTALPAGDHAEFIARRMIPVRAFENQVFVAYVNHCGADDRFAYAGLSTIAAPDGSVLAAAEAEGEALLLATIQPEDFTQSAAQNTYLRDLRI